VRRRQPFGAVYVQERGRERLDGEAPQSTRRAKAMGRLPGESPIERIARIMPTVAVAYRRCKVEEAAAPPSAVATETEEHPAAGNAAVDEEGTGS
jgi:hypothetical protein